MTDTPTPAESETPTPSATPTPTPTPTPTETLSASPTPEPEAGDTSDDDSGLPSWVWWLLAALAIAAAIAIPLFIRASRRKAWHTELAAAEAEAAWLARELVPELRRNAGSIRPSGRRLVGRRRRARDRRRGRPHRPHGVSLRTTPRSPGRPTVRDAVRDSRQRLDALAGCRRPGSSLSAELDAIAAVLETRPGDSSGRLIGARMRERPAADLLWTHGPLVSSHPSARARCHP